MILKKGDRIIIEVPVQDGKSHTEVNQMMIDLFANYGIYVDATFTTGSNPVNIVAVIRNE